MTGKRDLERRLAHFYEAETPRRAPDWVLAEALATIDITTQRRWFIPVPWRFKAMHGSTRLAAAVIAVVALAAAGLAVLSGGGPFKPPAPTPSISPTVAPTVADRRVTTPNFRPRFKYALPSDVPVEAGGDTDSFIEFRVPDSGGVGRSAWFLTVHSVGGGRVFPCATTPGRVPLADAQGAMAYLKTVPSVTVSGETTTTVDGRSALTATVKLASPDAECQQLSLWSSDPESIPDEFRDPSTTFRMTLLDVDGSIVAMHTIATREELDWFRWADEIIGSIQFEP